MTLEVQDWGLIDYNEAWDKQKLLVADIQKNRGRNVLVFCQHPSVITIGKNGSAENVKLSEDELRDKNIQVIYNNRGGDVTLHNPGQLVGYPIFDLSSLKEDLHWFLRSIEQCIIDLVAKYGITGDRYEGFTGVWIDQERKICAMGLNCSRWVTSHGFALNVTNDMSEFDYIVPCGIDDKKVCSMESELMHLKKAEEQSGIVIDIEKVKFDCQKVFENIFFDKK